MKYKWWKKLEKFKRSDQKNWSWNRNVEVYAWVREIRNLEITAVAKPVSVSRLNGVRI